MKKLILASQSPRRKELLQKQGIKFDVVASQIPEEMNSHLSPTQNALRLSRQKALDVAAHSSGIILAADTIVVIGKKILGKPKDAVCAKEMLETLSGRTHIVITAFTLYDTETQREFSQAVKTKVTFKSLTPNEIENYIQSQHPYDKAGGYAVQENGDKFIDSIEGSYTNIVGLPIEHVVLALKKFGF